MAFSLPRLPPDGGTAAERQIWWEEVVEAIEAQEARQDTVIADLATAQAALAAAQADIIAAQADIVAAQADIITSQNAANDALRNLARLTSYTEPSEVLSATDAGASASITIANHNRLYPGPFVADIAITGVTLTGRAYSTTYYIYYDDPTLADTTPSFAATTVAKDAQMGANDARHYLGSITTPAAAAPPTTGSGGSPPGGYGDPLP